MNLTDLGTALENSIKRAASVAGGGAGGAKMPELEHWIQAELLGTNLSELVSD